MTFPRIYGLGQMELLTQQNGYMKEREKDFILSRASRLSKGSPEKGNQAWLP